MTEIGGKPLPQTGRERIEQLLACEWLVTNGLGGYASGTVCGVPTRRYHGLLIAALPTPFGRMEMLNHLSERICLADGTCVWLGGEERPELPLELPGIGHLADFRLEDGLPVWRFEIGGLTVERRILLPHLQNTVYVIYRLLSEVGPVRLELWPQSHFRAHEAPLRDPLDRTYQLTANEGQYELSAGPDLPVLRMRLWASGSAFTLEGKKVPEILYRMEESRGYASVGDLWSPGHFQIDLAPGETAALVASTEAWEVMNALPPDEALRAERERRRRLLAIAPPRARTAPASELVLAADKFVISPAGRVADAARAHAVGDEVRTIIAGYHWFTDWGRDTMISLEGLTLATGRYDEARYILRTFAHYVRAGLIPNLFPEGEKEGLYHTADATLWFFHAIDRYQRYTGDRDTLQIMLPVLVDIVEHHLRGTRFGIGVDPADGLLRQGALGYQLTWMDAKVDDWVVTPRRGKAVEINALWYNAVRLLEGWLSEEQGAAAARPYAELADQVRESFNRRFWYADGGYLYDVVDGERGDDPACRPNQLFAISLPHPVLDRGRWEQVLEVARTRLLTPVGLRSLAPDHPDYKAKYFGSLHSRDAAYHQGTVWPWLIGPFVDAWLKVYPHDRSTARDFLQGLVAHLEEACAGSISEIFDAESPYTPRGCIAQAWSVAEVLRSWVKTAGGDHE